MRQKLFLAITLLLFAKGFSQTTAFTPPDIMQCNNEVFDLTVQNMIVLGNQDPLTHTITYHTSMADAEDNANPIANPQEYIGQQMEEIFVRVTYMMDDSYDVASFNIGWNGVFVWGYDDQYVCDSFTLPEIELGNFYTGPMGTGTMLNAGDVIITTQTIYIYDEMAGCNAEESFTVTVEPIVIPSITPLIGCDDNDDGIATFDLSSKIPEIMQGAMGWEVTFYETFEDAEAGATNNMIININSYTNILATPQTIYVRVTSIMGNCSEVSSFDLIIDDCNDNVISGMVSYDALGNNCTAGMVPAAGILVSYVNANDVFYTYTNSDGEYTFMNVPDGVNYVSVAFSETYTASPMSREVMMPGVADGADFCLSIPDPLNDVAVFINPQTIAQPGFMATYAVMIYNFGSFTASGDVTLQFDNTKLMYSDSTPAMTFAGNTLSISYSDLEPFQYQYIYVNFQVMPDVVNLGDILTYTATITPLTGDDYPENNTFVLNQAAVNSWDPNDIRVHEGETITEEQADGYLHYTIRFENLGTANAVNVRIETELDELLDASTFQPLESSHEYVPMVMGNSVEFMFNDIQLPFTAPDSQGYITYRIKPMEDIQLGDVIEAQAGIYFDFNDPVMTNVATTTVQNLAGINDVLADSFVIYPNPASTKITLQMKNIPDADVTVIDVLGKTVLAVKVQGAQQDIDVSSLNSGLYFVKVAAGGKSVTKKLIVK